MSEPASTAAWPTANPPPDATFRQSSPESPGAPAGESSALAARELLDELALLQCDAQRTRALAEEPL